MQLLLQILLSVSVAVSITVAGPTPPGMSESDILKTVFYGSEDALRGTLEDIELGAEEEEDLTLESAQTELNSNSWPGGQEFPRETRMEYICENLAEAPTSEIVRSIQYKLGRIQPAELRLNVMKSLNSKKSEMFQCCNKTIGERYECMDQARRNRYNRICEGETPCPWALLKGRHPDVSLVVNKCCSAQDNARYRCFLASRLDQKCYRRPKRSRSRI